MNRNLVLNSSGRSSNKKYLTHEYYISPSEGQILSNGYGYLETGKLYTMTICVTPSVGATKMQPFVSRGYHSLTTFTFENTQKQILTKSFHAHYYKGRTPQDGWGNARIEMYCFPNDASVKTTDTIIHWVKIEEGSEFTGYCPAPEDIPSYHLYEDMFEQGSFYSNNNGNYEAIKTTSGFDYQIRTKNLIPINAEKIAIHISSGYRFFLSFFKGQENLKQWLAWKNEDKWWDVPAEADHFGLVLKRDPEDTSVPMQPSEIAQICGGGSVV